MRVGHNPMMNSPAEPMPPIVAAVIVHLPKLTGYHEQRMPVVQACLQSMRKHAGQDAPVLVWDNGSCSALRDWLHDEFNPEYLVHSPNVGKSSARASILHMLPETTVVALSDDDMLFYPGWLPAHLQILQRWPQVGAVSGWPVRTSLQDSLSATVQWAEKSAIVKRGNLIPGNELRDFAVSIGIEKPGEFTRSVATVDDILIEHLGLRAYANAQHCQFACYAGRIAPLCHWERAAMLNEKPFDAAINAAGLLRVTTEKRYTRHLGNVIDEASWSEIREMEIL